MAKKEEAVIEEKVKIATLDGFVDVSTLRDKLNEIIAHLNK